MLCPLKSIVNKGIIGYHSIRIGIPSVARGEGGKVEGGGGGERENMRYIVSVYVPMIFGNGRQKYKLHSSVQDLIQGSTPENCQVITLWSQ